jgi:hypothetical protein
VCAPGLKGVRSRVEEAAQRVIIACFLTRKFPRARLNGESPARYAPIIERLGPHKRRAKTVPYNRIADVHLASGSRYARPPRRQPAHCLCAGTRYADQFAVPGAIGFVEYGFAKQTGLPMATLENRAGKFVKPDLKTGTDALASIKLPLTWVPGFPTPRRGFLSNRHVHLAAVLQEIPGPKDHPDAEVPDPIRFR